MSRGSVTLGEAIIKWFESPINDHGTPYVSIPEDFTTAEAEAFVCLIREPRLVPRDEQVTKLREIVARRTK